MVQIHKSVSYLKPSWEPVSVVFAVQSGTTILPQEGKRKTAIHTQKTHLTQKSWESLCSLIYVSDHSFLLDCCWILKVKRFMV